MLKSISIILMLFTASISAQNQVEFFDLRGNVAICKRSSVSIEKSNLQNMKESSFVKLGSGFYVLSDSNYFAVTNKHVVNQVTSNEKVLIGVNYQKRKLYHLVDSIKYHSKLDVSILRLSKDVFIEKINYIIDSTLTEPIFTTTGIFASDSRIVEGAGVLIIGYPLGLGASTIGNNPISRIGIVGQGVNEEGTFIVDGLASHGNSGSPIFDATTRHFFGIIQGYHRDVDSTFMIKDSLYVPLPIQALSNSGLAVCISASKIKELLEEF